MEPLNCTVHVRPDSCELWVGTQVLAGAQAVAAKVTGLPLEKVTARNYLIGGGFGRRLDVDYIELAVRIAQKVDGPVKVVWTREEDMQHDVYRPVYHDHLAATVSGGKIVGWRHRIAGSAIIARWLPPAFQKGVDIDAVDAAIDVPYDIPNMSIEYVRNEPPGVPTGFWRGVGPNNNVFAIEGFVDELARKAGQDPIAFRRAMLDKTPRLQAALDLVVSKAGWGRPLPARNGGRTGRGICVQAAFGSYIATVAEVEVDRAGEVRVERLVCAVDTGIVVNPGLGDRPAAGRPDIRSHRRAVRRDHNREGSGPTEQFPRLPDAADGSGSPDRGASGFQAASRRAVLGKPARPPGRRRCAMPIFAATGIALRRLPIDRDVLAGKKDAITGKKSA